MCFRVFIVANVAVLSLIGTDLSAEQLTVLADRWFVPAVQAEDSELQKPLTRFRGRCRMLLLADGGRSVTIRLTNSQVSRRYSQPARYSLISPSGTSIKSLRLDPGQQGTLELETTGAGVFELLVDARQNATQVTAANARLCMPASREESCRVIRGSQRLWFYVPTAAQHFHVHLKGQGTAETAAVEVFDPTGTAVAQASTVPQGTTDLEVPVPKDTSAGLWSLRIVRAKSGVLEDAEVYLTGDVSPLLAQRPDHLFVPLAKTTVPGVFRRWSDQQLTITARLLAPPDAYDQPRFSFSLHSVEAADGLSNDKQNTSSVEPIDDRAMAKMNVATADLAPGRYQVNVNLLSGFGDQQETVYRCDEEMFAIDRPRSLSRHGITACDGKPFFARGLYHVRPEDYGLVRSQGFNIVQAHPDCVPQCDEAGLKAAVALYAGMKVNPDYYREKVNSLKRNSAVACWMIMDEPAANNVPLARIERAYGLIRTLDPDRPAYMCICRPDAYTSFGRATDILAIDVYPVRDTSDQLLRICETLDIARRDVPEQPVWFIGQVWSWPGREDPEKRRLVTAAEHRCMTYLALTRDNVRGLMWYSFRDPDWYLPESNPEVWNECKRINRELVELEDILLKNVNWQKQFPASTTAGKVIADESLNIHAALREHDGRYYLLAVNPHRVAVRGRLRLAEDLASNEADVLFEKRQIAVNRGTIHDHFKPLAVHIYRIRQD